MVTGESLERMTSSRLSSLRAKSGPCSHSTLTALQSIDSQDLAQGSAPLMSPVLFTWMEQEGPAEFLE